ncbi:Cilia- and flagella-associated protein 43 [Cichlidogyrus casuarinus]|uniref:Cilia- and flagella-associated protein 43 n=1 Tax=Cichlidogyrus casuarinus TaxID=1844966 RepID=A0ABD2QJL3_9PLAT
MDVLLAHGDCDRICLLALQAAEQFSEMGYIIAPAKIKRMSTLYWPQEDGTLCLAAILQQQETVDRHLSVMLYFVKKDLLKNPSNHFAKPTHCIFDEGHLLCRSLKIASNCIDLLFTCGTRNCLNLFMLESRSSPTNKLFKQLKLSHLEVTVEPDPEKEKPLETKEILDLTSEISSDCARLKRIDGTLDKAFIYNSSGAIGMLELQPDESQATFKNLDQMHRTFSNEGMHVSFLAQEQFVASCAMDCSIVLAKLEPSLDLHIDQVDKQLAKMELKRLRSMDRVECIMNDFVDEQRENPEPERLMTAFRHRILHTFQISFTKKAEIEEDKRFASERKELRRQLEQLRNQVHEMYLHNESLEDYQKLIPIEFDLDFEEQAVINAETSEMVKKSLAEIKREDLTLRYQRKKLLDQVWEDMTVKGRTLCGFHELFEVPNYPIKEFNFVEEEEQKKTELRRQIDQEIRSELQLDHDLKVRHSKCVI